MKSRIKSTAIYHAEPESSKCFMMKHEILENKLRRGNITPDEMEKLADYKVRHQRKPKPEKYYIPVWGKMVEVTRTEYNSFYSL